MSRSSGELTAMVESPIMACRTCHSTSVDVSGNLCEPSSASLKNQRTDGSEDFNFSITKDVNRECY